MADSVIYSRVHFAPWSNLDSETKKATKWPFLDISTHSLKIQHALRPHLWTVQEGRNKPNRHSYACGSRKWTGQNILVHRDQISVAKKKKNPFVIDTDGIWSLLSHYTPPCCTNSWDALWPPSFCRGQGRSLRQQRSGSSSHTLHPLHKGPCELRGWLLCPSQPPATTALSHSTPCQCASKDTGVISPALGGPSWILTHPSPFFYFFGGGEGEGGGMPNNHYKKTIHRKDDWSVTLKGHYCRGLKPSSYLIIKKKYFQILKISYWHLK